MKNLTLNQILTYILILLAAILILGTAIGFISGKASFKGNYRRMDPSSAEEIPSSEPQISFKEFGTLRTLTKPETDSAKGSVLVISPWFSIPASDTEFREELFQKKKLLSAIITGFFSEYSKKELLSMGEKKCKEMLSERLNSQLIMGKISTVYFDDYMFIE